jgi:hypothetical protein
MKTPPVVNAYAAWSALASSWMQMMAASAPVIASRTRNAQTPAQWLSIGTEKVLAGMESTQAMSRHLLQFPSSDPFAVWTAWGRMLGAGVKPYRTRARRSARRLPRR